MLKYFLFLMLFPACAYAQADSLLLRKRSHAVFAEVMGSGGYGAVGYEQKLSQKGKLRILGRAALGLYRLNDFIGRFNPDLIVPLTFTAAYGGVHSAEAGLGQAFTRIVQAGETSFLPDARYRMSASGYAGYRLEAFGRKVLVRVAYTPLWEHYKYVRHWAAVSIGYTW